MTKQNLLKQYEEERQNIELDRKIGKMQASVYQYATLDKQEWIDFEEENSNLINTQNLKKQPVVEKSVQDVRKIKLDTKQIQHQRALDYTTRQNNSMLLPTF